MSNCGIERPENALDYKGFFKLFKNRRPVFLAGNGQVQKVDFIQSVYPSDYQPSIFAKGPSPRTWSASYVHDFSLSDAGIIPNNYNDHIAFETREEAVKYIQDCKEFVIGKET